MAIFLAANSAKYAWANSFNRVYFSFGSVKLNHDLSEGTFVCEKRNGKDALYRPVPEMLRQNLFCIHWFRALSPQVAVVARFEDAVQLVNLGWKAILARLRYHWFIIVIGN